MRRNEYPRFFIDFETVNVAAWRPQQTSNDAPIAFPIHVKLKRSTAYSTEMRESAALTSGARLHGNGAEKEHRAYRSLSNPSLPPKGCPCARTEHLRVDESHYACIREGWQRCERSWIGFGRRSQTICERGRIKGRVFGGGDRKARQAIARRVKRVTLQRRARQQLANTLGTSALSVIMIMCRTPR